MGRERVCSSVLKKQTLGNGWVVVDTKLALLHDLVYIFKNLHRQMGQETSKEQRGWLLSDALVCTAEVPCEDSFTGPGMEGLESWLEPDKQEMGLG